MKSTGLAVVVMSCIAASASAATLDYDLDGTAALRCPNKTRFADEVSAKLGFSPWAESGQPVKVHIEAADGGGYTGTLSSASDRERHFASDSCRKVADLLVTAVAISLDHTDHAAKPLMASSTVAVTVTSVSIDPNMPVAQTPAMQDNLRVWSMAPRNNLFQLGLGFLSNAGVELNGRIPVGGGHIQASVAYFGDSSEFNSDSTYHAHAYYMWPIFYINKGGAWEMPIVAGGGLGIQHYSNTNNTPTMPTTSDTSIMPTVAIGDSMQFNGFPVELALQMSLSLTEPAGPLGSRFGFSLAARYVFGRTKTRDVVRFKDL
jgi:hypothetical protein